MESFKEDLRKWTNEEIESQPGRLAAQIVLNRLIKNDFQMWFIGNVDGNQLYTVTLSNEQKAIVAFTDEYIASNYINRSDIIRQVRQNFGPKVVLVSMSLYKIDEISLKKKNELHKMETHNLKILTFEKNVVLKVR